jgi:hypothetical protein
LIWERLVFRRDDRRLLGAHIIGEIAGELIHHGQAAIGAGEVLGVCAVTVAGRQLLASASGDKTVRIWDPATGQAQARNRVEGPLFACASIGFQGVAAGGEQGLYGFDILLGTNPGQ